MSDFHSPMFLVAQIRTFGLKPLFLQHGVNSNVMLIGMVNMKQLYLIIVGNCLLLHEYNSK
jgi:hypothetical protein